MWESGADGMGNEKLGGCMDDKPPSYKIQSQQGALCRSFVGVPPDRHSAGHRALRVVGRHLVEPITIMDYPPTFRHPCGGVIFALFMANGASREA